MNPDHPNIIDVKHHTNKVGILPYRQIGDTYHWLIYLPKAKHQEEQSDVIWGVARGTVRQIDNDGQPLHDIRDASLLSSLPLHHIESHEHTAWNEALEELGLSPEDTNPLSFYDHGIHIYRSAKKGDYPIHFFSVAVINPSLEVLKERATDAMDLSWKSLDAIKNMVSDELFKPNYISIITAVEFDLTRIT